MLRLTSHAIVGEALAELVDHDEEDTDRVSAHRRGLASGGRQSAGKHTIKVIFNCPLNSQEDNAVQYNTAIQSLQWLCIDKVRVRECL